MAALIISFQEPFDIQEFPTGNIVFNAKLCYCADSLPLHRLLSGKFVIEAAMDGWSLSCAFEHAYTELSSFADVSKVISCDTVLLSVPPESVCYVGKAWVL